MKSTPANAASRDLHGGPPRSARPSIAAAHAPPRQLVFAHFIAGAACAAAGACLLAGGIGDPAMPLHPPTLAVVHLWVAGWLSLTAVGVLVQFMPVTTGSSLFSVTLGWIHLALHTTGVAGLAAGVAFGLTSPLTLLAGTALWSGLALAALNLGATLLRAGRWDTWRTGLALALVHAIVTPTAGWLLLAYLGDEFVARHHLALVVAHAHAGLGGWLFGLVIAVGGRLLPMFVAAPEPARGSVVVALLLVQGAIVGFALAIVAPALALAGPLLLAAAVLWWTFVLARSFVRRKTRRPDLPLAVAWGGLAAVCITAVAGLDAVRRIGLDGWSTYGVLALGGAGLMVNGLLYRIVPFMVRLAAFRRSKTATGVPGLTEVLRPIPYRAQMAGQLAGVLCLVAGTMGAGPGITRLGSWLLAAGTVGLLANLVCLVSGRAARAAQAVHRWGGRSTDDGAG